MVADVTVLIKRYNAKGEATVLARVWIDEHGQARCDDAKLLERWTKDGIVGRASRGVLYPKDGSAFVEELPFIYRAPQFVAERED